MSKCSALEPLQNLQTSENQGRISNLRKLYFFFRNSVKLEFCGGKSFQILKMSLQIIFIVRLGKFSLNIMIGGKSRS